MRISTQEWVGTCRANACLVAVGLALLIRSTLIVGYGNSASQDFVKGTVAEVHAVNRAGCSRAPITACYATH